MSSRSSPSPRVFRHADNIEEVDYLSDYVFDDEGESDGDEPSEVDSSMLECVPLTPLKPDESVGVPMSNSGTRAGYTPLQKTSQALTVYESNDHSSVSKENAIIPATSPIGDNVLLAFQSPPESKPRKALFEEGFSVDNRAKTPMHPVQRSPSTTDSDGESQSPISYFPSKYLQDCSSPQQPTLRYSSSPANSLSVSGFPAQLTGAAMPSGSSPSDQSDAAFSNYTVTTVNSRRQSVMSSRSSTSMSMLFGEVINLEASNRNFSTGTGPRKSMRETSLVPHVDGLLRKECLSDDEEDPLEGMEIGNGGHRPVRTLRGIAVPLMEPGERPVPLFSLELATEYLSELPQHLQWLGQSARAQLQKVRSATSICTRRVLRQYRPPLSPRARELEDLSYLQHAHQQKVGRMKDEGNIEDHYDFVLVLTPQENYKYWAELLDFRVEHLGVDTFEPTIESASTRSTDDDSFESDEMVNDEMHDFSTPLTGMHRRRGKTLSSTKETPSGSGTMPRPSFARSESSQGNQIFLESASKRRKTRLSMFEKAVGIHSPLARNLDEDDNDDLSPMHQPRPTVASVRRRWGNRAMHTQGTATMLSPPVRSLTRGTASVRKPRATPSKKTIEEIIEMGENRENKDPNCINSENDIPNPVIPRGIAARTNGMLQFLSALKRGIVVRRHRANRDPVYCKIISSDGGDTINYQLIDAEEAMVAFKEQRVRYNRKLTHSSSPASVRAISQEWSCLGGPGDGSPVHKFKVPDHVAAQRYREQFSRSNGIRKRVLDLATKAANSGIIRASDIVAVHPAAHLDPRHPGVRKGELGTATLRKSKAGHYIPHSFSLVSVVGQRFANGKNPNAENNENKWYSGEGSELQFKALDFEAASEGEYWLVFRGFLLLHRDATVGRFAAQRKAGIAGGNRSRDRDESEHCEDNELENRLHRDEFHEPKTVGLLEKAIVRVRKLDDSYMKGFVLPDAVPPPSDYFLGFKSPGTQIWSRLRLAGFETQRLYSVDTRRVMIKVRCPEDRLTDVAEVLRLQMKTVDDTFAPFREDTADLFKPIGDPLDVPAVYEGKMASLLRSKYRQAIIDFIIGSRIRDSGAELGQTTDVGKMIQARVPLHMPQKLESIYRAWVFYWCKENWARPDNDCVERSDEAPFACESASSSKEDDAVPSFITRLLFGAFLQPLDSIEEYFGEQVTFYFAWLQHCSVHLLFLAALGLIVTIIQLLSDNLDHPIRPFFAMVVMIWSFIVLVNWKKRSNYLAYRWGSMDHEIQETPRPEFHGEYVVDEITQEWVVKYPKWKRWLKYLISVPITVAFTGTVLLLILLVHANRDLQMAKYVEQLSNPDAEPFKFELAISNIGYRAPIVEMELTKELILDPTFWVAMGALPAMLGLCIPIMNVILMRISVMLNDFENYRTESEYRTHLIIKVFSFRFVSQFGTVYYYAYMSTGSPQAIENGIIRMGTSVMVYTTVAHWWQIFLQVYLFMLIRKIRQFQYQRKLQQELKNIELEEEQITSELSDAESRQIKLINKRMLLDQAQDDAWFEVMNPQHNSFPEYITAVVQFSFVACFSVVLPITPLFCLFNYLVSIRFDAYKLCRGRQRPLAKKTGGIGVWEHLLHIVSVIAVLTNCWLMGFTSSDFSWIADKVGTLGIFAIVVAWEHIMLLIKYVMQTSVSQLPRSVRDEIKRKQHESEQERYSNLRIRQTTTRRSKFEKPGSNRERGPKTPTWTEKEVPADFQTPDAYLLRTIPSEEESSNLFSC